MENNKKSPLILFKDFFKIGCFTFGGGWSIVAQIQKKYVEEENVLTNEEILDITSVGRSLPGTMIGNVAFLFGYHCAGFAGGLVCVLGMVIPPFIMISIVTYIYSILQGNVYVMRAMAGVRASIVPIILSSTLGLMKGAFKFKACYAAAIFAFVLTLFFNFGCITLIILGAVFGLVICEFFERRESKESGYKTSD